MEVFLCRSLLHEKPLASGGSDEVCPLFRDKVVEMERDKTQCAQGQAALSSDPLLKWLFHTLIKAIALHFKE